MGSDNHSNYRTNNGERHPAGIDVIASEEASPSSPRRTVSPSPHNLPTIPMSPTASLSPRRRPPTSSADSQISRRSSTSTTATGRRPRGIRGSKSRMTNLMFCLLGMVPSLLLYFSHMAISPTMPTSLSSSPKNEGSASNNHMNMAHQERLKQQFQQDAIPQPKPLRVADPYTPTLLTPQTIDPAYNRTLLHFVKTRFMQYQANLTVLGEARLELLQDFCMPSVVHQTTQNFVWLIYTDPELHADLLHELVDLMAPYPNYYVIQTLSNQMWKGGQAVNMTRATVLTGVRAQLEAFMALRNTVPVLETRLDADDAIHVGYLAEVQRQALQLFTPQTQSASQDKQAPSPPILPADWMYWCVNQELEWNWIGPQGYTADQKDFGVMESKPYEDFCPTPGLTLGYAAATAVEDIYTRKHSMLVERLHTKLEDFCGTGRPGAQCYQIIRNFEYPAFRCRTPTSASMVMTDFSKAHKLEKLAREGGEDPRWKALHDSFDVPRNSVHKANQYLTDHILDIAREAIMGQCTKGHSCSKNAKKKLMAVLERYSKLLGQPLEGLTATA